MNINTTIKTEKLDEHELNATANGMRSVVENGKPKSHRRKKLRRLADDTKPPTNKRLSKCKRVLVFTALFTFTIALLMGHYYTQNNSNTKQIIKEFLKNYRSQYTQIIHGKQNYCDQKQQLATPALFERIKQYRILNQEKPLQEIEVALRNDSDFNAIALVGAVGVGKSLFMRAMIENFPWQENVQRYALKTYVKGETDKFHVIRLMVDNLSDCGQNLLVIENLRSSDNAMVTIINKLLMESIAEQQKRVIVFYVFSLNTMLPSGMYDEQKEMIQILPNTAVINFNSFGKKELKDCIERETELEGVNISSQDKDEIVATIEPSKSGCKNANAKVMMYGTIRSKDIL